MSDFPFDCVGFDLDGTLVDSAGDIAASVNAALAALPRAPLSIEQVRPMIGGGSRELLSRVLQSTGDESELDRLLPILLDYYEYHMTDLTRPFAGAVEALDALAMRGVTLAIVTNKREHFAVKLLRALDLSDRFTCVIGGDSAGLAAMKPDRAPIDLMIARCGARRAAFVGDSHYDVLAAQAAGIPVALFGDADIGADIRFAHYADLVTSLEALSAGQCDAPSVGVESSDGAASSDAAG